MKDLFYSSLVTTKGMSKRETWNSMVKWYIYNELPTSTYLSNTFNPSSYKLLLKNNIFWGYLSNNRTLSSRYHFWPMLYICKKYWYLSFQTFFLGNILNFCTNFLSMGLQSILWLSDRASSAICLFLFKLRNMEVFSIHF